MKSVKKILNVSGIERRFFLEALVLHLWIGLMLKIIPFKRIPRIFSSPQPPTYAEASVAKSSLKSKDVLLVKVAIQRAGRASPWKNRCLVSSLAGRCMLIRRKIDSQLSLGVAKNSGGKTIAHAWLRAGDVEIVLAGEGFREFYHF
ncbi:MAG: lasso peptide biosynthesis B2 protein [Bacteroidales bacterium]|nr:lasso peptide biosynthesis B2 protein [Bacteroidales bacterium]